jgi:serine/threonine protein kinase
MKATDLQQGQAASPARDAESETIASLRDGSRAETLLFSRYAVLRELGRGGMGLVLLAHDRVLGLPVALKMVPEHVVNDVEAIADLKREVLRGIALTHKNIVRVFSFDQDDSAAAIVMEYVEGATLSQLKAQQPGRHFDVDTIQAWLSQLCPALDYAHSEAQIAHRDLKPRNLMLATSGQLKVADFGLASSLSEAASRTSTKQNGGTPAYMSPQQAMGEIPSALDDIYALGATLYELTTGKPPFFRGDIIAQLMHETPPPMAVRRRELGILDSAPIPMMWEKLVADCLAKNPAARPPSGKAVLEYFSTSTAVRPLLPSRPPISPMDQSTPFLPAEREEKEPERRIVNTPRWREHEIIRKSFQLWPLLRPLGSAVAAALLAAGAIQLIRHFPSSSAQPGAAARSGVESQASSPAAPEAPRSTALSTGRIGDPPKRLGRHGPPP